MHSIFGLVVNVVKQGILPMWIHHGFLHWILYVDDLQSLPKNRKIILLRPLPLTRDSHAPFILRENSSLKRSCGGGGQSSRVKPKPSRPPCQATWLSLSAAAAADGKGMSGGGYRVTGDVVLDLWRSGGFLHYSNFRGDRIFVRQLKVKNFAASIRRVKTGGLQVAPGVIRFRQLDRTRGPSESDPSSSWSSRHLSRDRPTTTKSRFGGWRGRVTKHNGGRLHG